MYTYYASNEILCYYLAWGDDLRWIYATANLLPYLRRSGPVLDNDLQVPPRPLKRADSTIFFSIRFRWF